MGEALHALSALERQCYCFSFTVLTVTCSARPHMIRELGPVLRLRSFALANERFLLIRFAAQKMGNDPFLRYCTLFIMEFSLSQSFSFLLMLRQDGLIDVLALL